MLPGRIWFHYLTLLPGPAAYGPWRDSQEVIVFAIGRNAFLDSERYRIRQARDYFETDAGTLQHLAATGFDPGDTNEELADALVWLMALKPTLHAYVQWEVAAALGRFYRELDDRITVLWPFYTPQATFNSRDVTVSAIQQGFGRNQYRPMVLASNDHRARAMLVMRKLLHRTPTAPPKSIRIYDPGSVQPWTASRRGWLQYEPRARGHYLLHRWVW